MTKSEFYDSKNSEIAHANAAYNDLIASELLGGGDLSDVRETTLQLIKDEQQAAIDDLNSRYEVDLAEALHVPDEVKKQIGLLTLMADKYEESDEARKAAIAKVAEYYVQILGLKPTLNEDAIGQIRQQLIELEKMTEVDYDDNPHLLKPWLIPVMENPDNHSGEPFDFPEYLDWGKEDDEDDGDFIDIFPDDLMMAQRIGDHVRAHNYLGHEPEASTLLALLAAASPGRVWTRADLASQVYANDGGNTARNRERVRSLLANYSLERGSRIDPTLADENPNLRMMIGRRYRLNKNGKKFGIGEQVCVVIDERGVSMINNQSGFDIVWEPMPTEQDSAVSAEDQQVMPAVGEVDVASASSALSMQEDLPHQDESAPTENGATEATNVAVESTEKPKERLTKAQKKLLSDAENFLTDEIQRLLFSAEVAGELDIEDLKKFIPSTAFGTRTNLERARAAGILNRQEESTSIVGSVDQIVAAAILNSNRDSFNHARKTAKSLELIMKMIDELRTNYRSEVR